MSNKISKSFRLSPDACAILSDLAKQSGTNETVTIERLIIDAGKSKDAHTITAKTHKVSYKSKKTRKNEEEQRYFFPNTHEPLLLSGGGG